MRSFQNLSVWEYGWCEERNTICECVIFHNEKRCAGGKWVGRKRGMAGGI